MSEVVGRSVRLERVLTGLLQTAPEVQAAAVVSFDGLPMASVLPPGFDEDRVAAMSAALLSLGERAAQGLGRGDLSQVYVEGENGTVFLVSADDEAVLVAVAEQRAKVGLMLFEVRRAAEQVAQALRLDDAETLLESSYLAADEAAAAVAALPPMSAIPGLGGPPPAAYPADLVAATESALAAPVVAESVEAEPVETPVAEPQPQPVDAWAAAVDAWPTSPTWS